MHVVLLVLDTVRRDALGVYDDAVDHTPHLDAFAEEATVYEDAVAQAPWTLPSHASMFTGAYPWTHGATQRHLELDTDTQLLAERFHEAGYRTACYTANAWVSPYTGMTRGFEETDNFFAALPDTFLAKPVRRLWHRLQDGRGRWLLETVMNAGERLHHLLERGNAGSKTEAVLDRAETFLTEADAAGEEAFLFCNLMDGHLPHHPPEEYRERHAPDVDPAAVPQDAAAHNGGREAADLDALRALYRADIDYLDDRVGRFFDALREAGLWEETVVVVAADHGELFGEDDRLGHQFSVHDALVHVPLMVRVPGRDDGRVTETVELRGLYDHLPGLAGVAPETRLTVSHAKGGYAYPQLDLRNIPDDRHDAVGRGFRYVCTAEEKLVAARDADGETLAETMHDRATGEELPVDDALRAHLPEAETVVGEGIEETDAAVRQRLEDLGYV